MRMHYGLTIWFVFLVPALAQQNQSTGLQLSKTYHELSELVSKIGEKGAKQADYLNLHELRRQFANEGADGALFIIGKLKEMLSSEQSINNCEEVIGSDIVLQNSLLEMQLFVILAESYPRLSPKVKSEVIQVLENGYTYPVACDIHGGKSALGWAFLRIGKDVMEALLRLADSSEEIVRCNIDELLNGVLEDNESTGNLLPPMLDCRADKKHRALQLASWQQWWQKNARSAKFPDLPDFDAPVIPTRTEQGTNAPGELGKTKRDPGE